MLDLGVSLGVLTEESVAATRKIIEDAKVMSDAFEEENSAIIDGLDATSSALDSIDGTHARVYIDAIWTGFGGAGPGRAPGSRGPQFNPNEQAGNITVGSGDIDFLSQEVKRRLQ